MPKTTQSDKTHTLLSRILDAGFGVVVSSTGTGYAITSSTDDSCMALAAGYGVRPNDGNISGPKTPTVQIRMPATLPLKFIQNAMPRMPAPPPKSKQRYSIDNQVLKYDTSEEYQEKLMEDYEDGMTKILDRRKEQIEDRLSRHADLQDAMKEMLEAKPMLVRRDNTKDKYPSMQARR